MSKLRQDDPTGAEPLAEGDELDAVIDYEGIVARTEADRQAGRVLSREQMRARTDQKLAEIRARRRSA